MQHQHINKIEKIQNNNNNNNNKRDSISLHKRAFHYFLFPHESTGKTLSGSIKKLKSKMNQESPECL